MAYKKGGSAMAKKRMSNASMASGRMAGKPKPKPKNKK